MEIRGLTREELELALERANAKYGGNLEFRDQFYSVKLAEPETITTKSGYSWTIYDEHLTDTIRPLNKKGTRLSVRLGVKSARQPGSRVSQRRYSYSGMSYPQRRISSACWHAVRDFLFEVFAINPDARVISALADYRGLEDFERKYPATFYGAGMSGPAPIDNIGDACNCDEGEYPEFATEGLTEEQYEKRAELWREGYLSPGAKRALRHPEWAITKAEVK